MELSEKIRILRQQRGLTFEEIGDYVGVSKATVLKWESGKIQNMRRDKIVKLAEILRVSPAELLGYPEDNFSSHSSFIISPHERAVIEAYRAHPALRSAVDRMLEVALPSPEDEANAQAVAAVVEAVRGIKEEGVLTK